MEPRWEVEIVGRLRRQWAGAVVAGLVSAMAGVVVVMLVSSVGLVGSGSRVLVLAPLGLAPIGFVVASVYMGRAGRGRLRYHDGDLALELGHRTALALQPERRLPILDMKLELAADGCTCTVKTPRGSWQLGRERGAEIRVRGFESCVAVLRIAIDVLAKRRADALERARDPNPPIPANRKQKARAVEPLALPLRVRAEAAETELVLGDSSVELVRSGISLSRLQLPLARAAARNTYRSAGKRKVFDGPALELADASGNVMRVRFAASNRPWLARPPDLRRRPDCVLPDEAVDPVFRWLAWTGVMDDTLLLRGAISFELREVLSDVEIPPVTEPKPEPEPRKRVAPPRSKRREGNAMMAIGGGFLVAAGVTALTVPLGGTDGVLAQLANTAVLPLFLLGVLALVVGLLHRRGVIDFTHWGDS